MAFRHPLLAALLGLVLLPAAARAQDAPAKDAPAQRLRGTIDAVDGSVLTIRPASGDPLTLRLGDGAKIVVAAKASLADIKPGAYVGIANRVGDDGKGSAIEVHIFPEAMRGTGDGQRAWDLGKASRMTNGAVGRQVTAVDGQTLDITFKGGQSTIAVKPDTQIMSFLPGSASDLKGGAHVFVREAKPGPDGTLQAGTIVVGRDGLAPAL